MMRNTYILFLKVYLFPYLDPNIQNKAIYQAVVLICFSSVSALLMTITLWTFLFKTDTPTEKLQRTAKQLGTLDALPETSV